MIPFSFSRWWAIVLKEFLQLRRDRVTFAMIVGIPIIQLTLFGFAINTDPKHLTTAIISSDESIFSRSLLATLKQTSYFNITKKFRTEAEGRAALTRGEVQFVVNIPSDFSRKLLRKEHPVVLVQADATDPSATGNAIEALSSIPKYVGYKDFIWTI